jgi:hypothetical protein
MKYLIIGDIHCRTIWKDIVAKESDYDKVIFLGDYLVPREVHLEDPSDVCGILYEILDFKEQNPDKVVLLRGNHDLANLGYYWAECSPRDPYSERYMSTKDVKEWFLSLTQWVYVIPDMNIVCSHAGISKEWLNSLAQYIDITDLNNINTLEPNELFAFNPCKLSDYNGDSATQPCTWIRPNALYWHCIDKYDQIVGHSRCKRIHNVTKDVYQDFEKPNIWVCDALEHNQYFVIEDGKFIVKVLPGDINKLNEKFLDLQSLLANSKGTTYTNATEEFDRFIGDIVNNLSVTKDGTEYRFLSDGVSFSDFVNPEDTSLIDFLKNFSENFLNKKLCKYNLNLDKCNI